MINHEDLNKQKPSLSEPKVHIPKDRSALILADVEAQLQAAKAAEGISNEVKKMFPAAISATELLSRNVEVLPKLIDPIFPKVGLVCLAGSSDTGKTALLRQVCLHIVAGEEMFLGFPITSTHKKGIYVSTEDDSRAISYLLHVQNKGKLYRPDQVSGLRYIFETEHLLENLDHELQEQPADVVILDCLSDLYGGKSSLNESTHVRAFLNPYKELADRHQCLIIFLHHTGKRTEDSEPSKRNLLGSQGIESKMRLVIELRPDNNDPSKRHFCIVKGNYLPREYKDQSFELRFDENMLFHNTGGRTPFEELIKIQGVRSPEQREHLIEQARELSVQGKSQREIAKTLNVGLGTVNGYLKGWSGVHVQPNP